jgi:hypothetical protein
MSVYILILESVILDLIGRVKLIGVKGYKYLYMNRVNEVD